MPRLLAPRRTHHTWKHLRAHRQNRARPMPGLVSALRNNHRHNTTDTDYVMTAAALAQCDVCTPLGFGHHQHPDEAAVWVEQFRQWLCEHCLKAKEQSSVPQQDGIYSRIPQDVYHGDRDSLSSSGARMLVNLTPAEYMAQLLEPPNPKPQYDFGHAAHLMVLSEGARLVCVDTPDWRTNTAKEAREKAWEHGKVPLLKKDIDLAQRMAGKVFQHPIAAKLLESGAAELSGYWHCSETGIRLRFRPDWIPEVGGGRPLICDYKTSTSANPKRFAKAVADWGYHQQAAWYIDGLAETTGAQDAAFLFICQMKDPPFLVSVVQLDAEAVELGRRQNRCAIELYAKCRELDVWPGYEDDLYTVSLPRWYIAQHEEQP